MEKIPENNKQYLSILLWITERGIVSEKGDPFDFNDRPFLLDILCDWNQNIVVAACAQIGKSVCFSLKCLFAVKHARLNIIYTFPTDESVREFVGSKFNKIIQANWHEFEGMEIDSVERKELNDRFIFFKGTVSKTGPISTTADLLIHDEVSRSDQGAIETYKSRLKASKYRGRWLFSNPTTERDELDLAWQKSDQKEWVIKCNGCGVEQFLTFPENVDFDKQQYKCKFCDAHITDEQRRGGKWVAQASGDTSGYHISHLMCPWIPCKDVIEESQGDPQYFNNFVLGLPYSPGDLQVNRTTILDLWTPKSLQTGNIFIGIDVGNIKHYTIRSEKGIIKIGRFTAWGELDDLITLWKPKAGVIDAMPDNTASKYYVEKYPWMKMSYFQENNNNPQMIVWYGENDRQGIIYSHRDRILDQMLTDMIEAKFLIGVTPDKDFNEFIKHFETLRRVKVVNNKGIERYVWESTTGVDHYVFSSLYAYLACLSDGNGSFLSASAKPEYEFIKNDNKMGNFDELFKFKESYE